jgi:TatD DNase family protein
MASDAHAHPFDLARRFSAEQPCDTGPGAAEQERRSLGIACAASAWNGEQFACHQELASQACRDNAAPMALCFAVHPQLPAVEDMKAAGEAVKEEGAAEDAPPFTALLELLETLAAEGRLNAVGETGIDLYDSRFRATEAVQEELFTAHLEIALKYRLPVVLHIRRAMHTVFARTAFLKKLPAVVFHSYSGTPGEAEALLRRGVNAYFSFGAVILLNHKEAIRSCAALPLDRLLLETDAPYQPLGGRKFSRWADLPAILRGAVQIRREADAPCGDPAELEAAIDRNFYRIFLPGMV